MRIANLSLTVVLVLLAGGCRFQESRPVPLHFSVRTLFALSAGSPEVQLLTDNGMLLAVAGQRVAAWRDKLVWRRSFTNRITAAAAGAGRTVVFLDNRRVVLLSSAEGRELYRAVTPGWVVLNPVSAAAVYWADQQRSLWSWRPPDPPRRILQSQTPFTTPPAVDNGTLWLGNYGKQLIAVPLQDEERNRSLAVGVRPDSRPVFFGREQALFFARNRSCYRIDTVRGGLTALLQEDSWCDAVTGSNGQLFYRSRSHVAGAVDRNGVLWRRQLPGPVYPPLPTGVWALIAARNGTLTVVYRRSGTVCGRLRLKGRITGQPLVWRDGVVVPLQDKVVLVRWKIVPGSV